VVAASGGVVHRTGRVGSEGSGVNIGYQSGEGSPRLPDLTAVIVRCSVSADDRFSCAAMVKDVLGQLRWVTLNMINDTLNMGRVSQVGPVIA
jgi:hypothetical protein